jgi:hypothetical protein
MSLADALSHAQADVQEAILQSKIEEACHQELVVLRLTKRNSLVLDALIKAPELENQRRQVEDADFEILPDWADGAILLAPLIHQQAVEADVHLRPHHIVVAQKCQCIVEQILTTLPKRRRPEVRPADVEYIHSSATAATVPKQQHGEIPHGCGLEASAAPAAGQHKDAVPSEPLGHSAIDVDVHVLNGAGKMLLQRICLIWLPTERLRKALWAFAAGQMSLSGNAILGKKGFGRIGMFGWNVRILFLCREPSAAASSMKEFPKRALQVWADCCATNSVNSSITRTRQTRPVR